MDTNNAQAFGRKPAGPRPSDSVQETQHPSIPDITSDIAPDMAPDIEFADETSTEDRLEARRKVLKKGQITYAAGNFQVDCVIKDLNSKGAKLRLSGDVTVPSCFDLVILPEKIRQKSQVCWKDGLDLGIQFIHED